MLSASEIERAVATAEDDAERTAFIKALYAGAATKSTVLDDYLTKTRKLPVLPEDCAQLHWLERERGDEGAMVGAFTDSAGKIVALQLTYITPSGEKSPIKPARRTYRGPLDWKERGFIQLGKLGKKIYLVESLEKGFAARLGGAECVLVIGGIGRRFELPSCVEEVVVVRDAESEALFHCRRKFARWARDLTALPVVDRPKELLNGKGDNWYPLRQIAHLAGKVDETHSHRCDARNRPAE
jgi:hypothetical protein